MSTEDHVSNPLNNDAPGDDRGSMNPEGIRMDVVDVCYSIMINNKAKRLLKNVNATFEPGDLCALMGPSGAGKSTLLDLLADRKKIGSWSGDVYVNNAPRSHLFHKQMAYVLQDDVHISTLTVEETLKYSAWTRLPEGTTTEFMQRRIDMLLHITGLEHVRNSIVGDAMSKGISGGQLKRLSIAVEIMPMPSLIFLDEPTSGLDSAIALEVMMAVRKLADQRRTIVSTIHQPSPEVFAMFDKLVLLAAGRLVFFGKASDAPLYFTQPSMGYHYDFLRNPAEFIIDISVGQLVPAGFKDPKQPEELELLFKNSKYFHPVSISAKADLGNMDYRPSMISSDAVELYATSKVTQLKMLLHRTWLSKVRDYADLKAQLIKNLVVAILIGIVFWGQGEVSSPLYSDGVLESKVANCSSVLFFTMMYGMVGNLQAIPYLCSGMVVYRRELAANAYAPSPYFVAQCAVALPINFAYHWVFFFIVYCMCAFPADVEYFCYYGFLLFFANTLSFYSAMWLAALTNNEQMAFALFPVMFLFLAQFSGYPITLDDVPVIWIWAPYVSYARWIFEGLMVNQWTQFDNDDYTGEYEDGNGDVLEIYSFENFDKDNAFWITSLFIGFFLVLTYIAMLPEKSKLVKVLNASDLVSQANSLVQRKSTLPGLSRTISKGLQESLLGQDFMEEEELPDEDEVLKKEPQLNVDFFRQSTGAITQSKGCKVVFHNVTYTVPNKMDPAVKTTLLRGVTGRANPGEMCALMGASGAGKSTLLDVLAERKNTGEIEGTITYNGSTHLCPMAYVMQDNVHIGLLTVRQSMYFAAELRLDEKTPTHKKAKRVQKVIDMLGLTHVAESMIGTETMRGISGGQLKRLSIGVEIIHLPDLMFLDEPTTGLDSSISFEVMSAVRNLANQNRTVICTIHQPSPETFALFDTILLLAEGRVIYFGPCGDVIPYFTQCPYQFHYKEGSNPADYVISVAGSFIPAHDGKRVTGSEMAAYYTTTDKFENAQGNLNDMGEIYASATTLSPNERNPMMERSEDDIDANEVMPYNTSTLFQMKTLLHRRIIVTAKDRKATTTASARHILVALFYGSLYYQLSTGSDPSAYNNRLSLFFFSLMFMIIGHQQSVPQLQEDRLVFYRERGAKAYGEFSYWISSWVIQVPLVFFNVMLFCLVIYYMSGLRADGFGYFYYFLVMTSLCGLFSAQFISAISPSTSAALSYYPMVLFFTVSFGGYLVYIPQFPDWLGTWAPDISFMRYGFQGLTLNEFKDNSDLPDGEAYIDNLGFDTIDIGTCSGVIFIFVCFIAIAYLIALKFVNFEQR